MSVRVLIVDDHAAVRHSLSQALHYESHIDVVGEAPDGGTAIRLAKELQPDVVIMDVVMPQLSGIDVTRQIVQDCPQVHVVGLSIHASRSYALRMLQAGAQAYVIKDGDMGELLHAIEAVCEGWIYLSPGVPQLSSQGSSDPALPSRRTNAQATC